MLERAVLPDLRARGGEPGVIASRVLRTWGESESGLNERLDDVIAGSTTTGDPTLAFLASGWEGLEGPADDRGSPTPTPRRPCSTGAEAELRELLGALVFGVDDESMESVVLDLLRAQGLTLGVAESLTGGLVAARLTAIAGRQRRVPRRRRLLRQRGQVRPARTCRPARSSTSRRRSRWPRACSGCSAPTSGSASPASPARPSRTACPSAPCASASPCRPARTPRHCASAPSASRSASSP